MSQPRQDTFINRELLPLVAVGAVVAIIIGFLWTLKDTRAFLMDWSWILVILGAAAFFW